MQEGRHDEDPDCNGQGDVGQPLGVEDQDQQEGTDDQIVLVGKEPGFSPFLTQPPFQETLGEIAEERAGCKEGDGEKRLLGEGTQAERGGCPDLDETYQHPRKDAAEEPPVRLSVAEDPSSVGERPPEIDGSPAAEECGR